MGSGVNMQHDRRHGLAFFCLLSCGKTTSSACSRDGHPRRRWTSVRWKRESVMMLLASSVCLTSMLGATADDNNPEEQRSVESSSAEESLQRGSRAKSGAPAEYNKPEVQPGGAERKKGKAEAKKMEKDKRKEDKGTHKYKKEDQHEEEDGSSPRPRCAQNLRDAVNGAISLIAGTRLLVEHLLRLWSSVPYVPMLVCPSSLFPYNPTLPWPKRENLRKGDLLRDVLDNGILTVAGVGGASLSSGQVQLTVAKDRGDEGNYNRAEPTGFFPDYLRAIADTIEKQYNAPIRVRWLFYPSVESAQAGVLRGEAHMTDIYFLLAHSTPGEPQPLAHFYGTCPVVGSPVLLIVRESPSFAGSEIRDLVSLNRSISRAKTAADRQIVFVSSELATTVRHCLSPLALTGFAEDLSQAAQLVLDGNALAVITTGVLPRLHPLLRVVSAHILLGKGAWIERTYSVECVEEEHGLDLSAYARERSPEEMKRVYGDSADASESNAPTRVNFGVVLCATWTVLLSLCFAF